MKEFTKGDFFIYYRTLTSSFFRRGMVFVLLQWTISFYAQTISISKSHLGTLKAGDVITYTVTATNNTATTMASVAISDPVSNAPAVFVPNSLIVGGTNLTCSVPSTITNAILISGFDLLPGESLVYSFQMKIPADYSGTSTISHTADMNSGAATATTSNNISALPNLAITKTGITDVTSGTVNPLGIIKYTLQINNTGTANAKSVVVNDALATSKFALTSANNIVLDFNGELQSEQARLYWATAMEKNVLEFEVERKMKLDNEFKTIGIVQAVGNSNTLQKYQLIDENEIFGQSLKNKRYRWLIYL